MIVWSDHKNFDLHIYGLFFMYCDCIQKTQLLWQNKTPWFARKAIKDFFYKGFSAVCSRWIDQRENFFTVNQGCTVTNYDRKIFVSFFSACKFDLTLQACTRADKKSYCRCRAVTSMKRAEAKIVNFLFTCERKI